MKSPDADEPDDDSREADATKANFDLPSTVGAGIPTDSRDDLARASLATLLDPSTKPGSIGKIQEYEVLTLQGRGAMGFVFRAFDPTLHRVVAIKVMVAELSATPGARERFVREAQSAASINHSNVVTVHAVGDHRGLPFLVMEYVQGQTLQELIHERGTLSVEDTLRIAHQVASGLFAAHQHGIVHRDVKPGNILIENGVHRVKIADFGLARVALESSGLTSHGQTVGTPGYMSPEQVEGLAVDCRADLFSLGCVIYAMLTGHTPFRAGNTLAVLQAVAKMPHAPLSEVAPTTPPALAQLVEKLLKKDPSARLGTAAEALRELEELLRTAGTPSRIAVTARQAEEIVAARSAAKARWLKIGGVSVVLSVLAIAAVLTFLPRRPQPITDGSTSPVAASLLPASAAPATVSQNDASGKSPAASVVLPSNVVVGDQPDADFRTIQEALDRQPAPTQIRVATSGVHTEAIVISGPRHAGLEIIWDGSGSLQAASGGVVVRIANAEGVTLRGFRITAQASQHGLMVEGRCPGLTVADCTITQPDGTPTAAVFFSKTTGASDAAPMRLQRTRISGSDLPIALIGSATTPVAHLHVEDCLILGVRSDTGTAVVIEGPSVNLRFRRNRIVRYAVGFSIGKVLEGFELTNNTLHDVRHFFATSEDLDPQAHLDVSSNLLIQVRLGKLDPHLRAIGMESFRNNLRVGTEPLEWPGVRDIPAVPFVSEETASPDFLRPAVADAVRLTPEDEDLRLRYAGAMLPADVVSPTPPVP